MNKPNNLIHETSPYLLQHAHNPVQWYAWNEETLALAKEENKLLLISIGYSSCHWCHVMEHESFEDEGVAEVMNKYFINVKVDREERPDVDQVYMSAVQLMTGSGGWPLNCIALPDGRPIWGGTYFRKDQWVQSLEQVASLYQKDPSKVLEYAVKLTDGVIKAEALVDSPASDFNESDLQQMMNGWKSRFDTKEGGPNRAPKFPLPSNHAFLLHFAHLTEDEKITEQVELTLDKMAWGGIYDQVGGGFARYSTDIQWKVPHFEKMLYDNAQLLSLYSDAFQVFQKDEYKNVVCETIEFLEREMSGPNGEFYSALDADSEGEEGKFYVWSEQEINATIKNDLALFKTYYEINKRGEWEGNFILLRNQSDEDFIAKNDMTLEELIHLRKGWKESLLHERNKRIRPGLDDKSLTSWNALAIAGYLDAYIAVQEDSFLERAKKTARFIEKNQMRKDGSLWHSYKDGKSTISGFLEDYAQVMNAFIKLYEVTGEEKWLKHSESLMAYCVTHFGSEDNPMFYFTSRQSKQLIARTLEKEDNVIPSSNSTMARNLFTLGHLYGKQDWITQSEQMLLLMKENMLRYGEGYSNWGQLLLQIQYPFYEVAMCGSEAEKQYALMSSTYQPNLLYAWSMKESNLPLLENRFQKGKSLIYVCQNSACKMPVESVEEAKRLLSN